jgi:N-acetylmuramoyl-L-alanine amidase
VKKCNSNDVDLDVSVHFNSGRNDKTGDGKIGGTEVWVRSSSGIRKTAAAKICNRMEKLGFYNRGMKTTTGLYFLNHTKSPAILVEICFVDDKDDAELYEKNKDAVAEAIASGIIKAFEKEKN